MPGQDVTTSLQVPDAPHPDFPPRLLTPGGVELQLVEHSGEWSDVITPAGFAFTYRTDRLVVSA